MKTKKSNGLTSVVIVIALMLGMNINQLYAQRGYGQGNGIHKSDYCLNIPNLSDDQLNQIKGLRTKHYDEMSVLREKRQSATTWKEKDEVGIQMFNKRIEHRDNIRNLLNDEQKTYFDENWGRPRNYRDNRFGRGHGRGQGRGQRLGY